MWDNATITMLLEGTRDTLYMTLVSTFFGYVLGLPLGILLAVPTKKVSVQMHHYIKFWM